MRHARARRTTLRSVIGLAGVIAVFGVFFLSKGESKIAVVEPLQWSERSGAGEIFAACASSALPVNPIVCVANVGATCYLSNSCGQKSAAGVVECDGTCGNKVETDTLTPSKHYLGTYDAYRSGYESGICALAGRPAWTGSYACAPNLNTLDYNSCSQYDGDSGGCLVYNTKYYAESNSGGWGVFRAGEGLCAETGIEWLACGAAPVAPPESSCPVTTTPEPTPESTPESTPATDTCGSASGATPLNAQPTGASACTSGALNANAPADTTLAWNWSCGIAGCSTPKYGCTTETDTNYNASGPNNTYGCANTCENGASASTYPACPLSTGAGCTTNGPPCCAPL